MNHFKIPKNSRNFLKICVGDSKPTVVEFDPKKEYGFEDFNMLIGAGRGEIVSLDAVRGMLPDAFIKDNGISSIDMWCDEEGKIYSKPHNPFGQAFWEKSFGRTDYIVGDIVLTGSADDEGDMLSFTTQEIDEIVKVIKTCWSSSELMQPKITIH